MVRALRALAIGLALVAMTAVPALAAVKVTVNGDAITDIQIAARAKLFQLEGRGANTKAAMEELINEALQLQEARRLKVEISESKVDDALQQVARGIKVSLDNLKAILQQNGVSIDTLRSRLKAALAWNEVTQVAIMPRVQFSEADLDKKAQEKMDPSMEFDYILKEVIFVIPGGKGNASKRTAEANRYRKSFQGCDSAVALAGSYTDAAVIDTGRRHATQLPDAIATELSKLGVGGITKPRVVETGVSMLAICSKTAANDTTFVKDKLRAEEGNSALKGEQDKYLAELRKKAKIIYE